MTQKPQSTISYNSEEFLKSKLNLWVEKHILQGFFYIKHIGEDGDKDHIHLFIIPNSRSDVMDFKDQLKEYVPGQKLPLGITWWQSSKFDPWVLYVVHDSDYMKECYPDDPGEKLPYSINDIVCSEGFNIELLFARAKAQIKHSNIALAKKLQQGLTPMQLILDGANPVKVNAVQRALTLSDYNKLSQDYQEQSKVLNLLLDFVEDLGYDIDRSDFPDLRIRHNETGLETKFKVSS